MSNFSPILANPGEHVYNYFVTLYGDPEFTKIKEHQGTSTYMVKTTCLLINLCRFLVVTVPNDTNEINSRHKLSSLRWNSFQTRTLKGSYDCGFCDYSFKSQTSYGLELQERKDEATYYKNNYLKIKITLLHTKTNNKYEYPNNTDLLSSLETFQSIVTF